MKRLFILITLILFGSVRADELYNNFRSVPKDYRVAVYWYWLSDNCSVEGVQHDLEAMKKAGITRAYIGNIWENSVAPGKVKVMTPEWWDVVHAALKKASELDIEIGIFNCPGWSQSGGPWIKPEQAMRYLKSDTITITGNGQVQSISLPKLNGEPVKTIAYPYTEYTKKSVEIRRTTDISFDSILRSIRFDFDKAINLNCTISYLDGDKYKEIKSVKLNRYRLNPNVGFDPLAPITVSIPDIKAEKFRITVSGEGSFRATLSDEPLVERFSEKSLAKLFQEPLPMWDEYMWATQKEPNGAAITSVKDVIDLTDQVHNGTLTWKAPKKGVKYTIIQTAMVPTGTTNQPASPEASGYEVDKMSRQHIAEHFNAFIGEVLRRIPPEDRTSFKVVVQDSYETGGQNWTDDMEQSFTERYGYSPIPFIPVLYGHVVGSQDQSERFLWDLRRLVADRVAYDYVGGLRDICHQNNLTTWLECYGHWGFPSEFLMYGGQSDEISGEFWSEGSLGDIENRAASSCAHTYGKNRVWAESCTSGGPNFSRYPAVMKGRTDRFFCEGINATLLHVFIHQTDDTTLPGISAWFGNDFQRKNTWFSQMDLFTDYLRRCNFLLQQGKYVADFAYFIGEDAPKMTGICNPPVPKGYSFDYINAEILKKAVVRDSCLLLPSGMSYKVLVLPDERTMRPEVLKKITEFVKNGLAVIGKLPDSSPSLKNYPRADKEVQAMSRMLKDRMFNLDSLKIGPDFLTDKNISFIHRRTDDREIYFLSNQSGRKETFTAKFRVSGMENVEMWNPVTAERQRFADSTITLDANESTFIVFSKKPDGKIPVISGKAFRIDTVKTPWTITFQKEMRGHKEDIVLSKLASWSESILDSIRYYSGTATYNTTYHIDSLDGGKEIYLDLGRVMVMAKVYINGTYAGGAWTAPYRIPVRSFLHEGDNHIRIDVVNNWQNRLIGDQLLPKEQRPTWTSVNQWTKDSPLQESGLIGPVTFQWNSIHY